MALNRMNKSCAEGSGITETCHSSPRLALILAAERLTARYGPSGFTVRMLNAEAGTRNTSALHYHFGSRDKLLRAVWQHRMTTINPRRLALLAQINAKDIKAVVEAIIWPLCEQLRPRPEGNHYLRFLERLNRDANFDVYGPDHEWAEGWIRAYALLRERLSGFPPEVVEMKVTFADTMIASILAEIESRLERGQIIADQIPKMAARLRDAVVAAVTVPTVGD